MTDPYMEPIPCEIIRCDHGKGFTVYVPFEKTYLLNKRITHCEMLLTDGRRISPEQRKRIHALLRDIAAWSGMEPEQVKALLKYDFIAYENCEYFSTSNCDMTTARFFLQFIIEFCIKYGVPCRRPLYDVAEDITAYVYACLVHKKCCLTGRKAELHHVDAVGTGRDRREIVHKGMRVLPLSREKHMEAHTLGRDTFCDKYHIVPVSLDEELCKIWKLKG